MSPQVTLIAVVLFLLGAALSYFFGLRAVQASRGLANYRLRQDYLARGRRSFVVTALLLIIAVAVFVTGRGSINQLAPGPTLSAAPTGTPAPQASPSPQPSAAAAAASTALPPTPRPFTSTPAT